jgi:transposase-like protein
VELLAASAVHQIHRRLVSGMRGFMDARTRLGWVRLYEQLGDAGKVCRRCGISQPTLRKWWHRYQADGVAGLKGQSRRPRRLAKQKVFAEQEEEYRKFRVRAMTVKGEETSHGTTQTGCYSGSAIGSVVVWSGREERL